MNFNMSKPCDQCPFRSDLKHGFLSEDRIYEITDSLFAQQSFPCHKTLEFDKDADELAIMGDSQQCVGAEIFLAHHGMSTQMSRIMERLGYSVSQLDMDAPVCKSVDEILEIHCF